MARRLSIQEEREIIDFMRSNPRASVRSVAQRFGRSRPTISDLRIRYALDRPQAPPEVQDPRPPGGELSVAEESVNLFEMSDEAFEALCARLEAQP